MCCIKVVNNWYYISLTALHNFFYNIYNTWSKYLQQMNFLTKYMF